MINFGPTGAPVPPQPWERAAPWVHIRERLPESPPRELQRDVGPFPGTVANPVDLTRLSAAYDRGRELHRMVSGSDATRRAMIHEAAHATVAYCFDLPLGSVEVGRGGHGTTRAVRPSNPRHAATIAAAGAAAEALVFGDPGDGSTDDHELILATDFPPYLAEQLAARMVKQFLPFVAGLSEVLEARGGRMTGDEVYDLLSEIDEELSPEQQDELLALNQWIEQIDGEARSTYIYAPGQRAPVFIGDAPTLPDNAIYGKADATPAPSVSDLGDLIGDVAELIDSADGGEITADPDLIAALQNAIDALKAAKVTV